MQHGKCCYCERNIKGSTLGRHVEHYRPQSRFPGLRNAWRNLLLACADCNGAKGSQFPEDGGQAILLDPSDPQIDPECHIGFTVGREPLADSEVFAVERQQSQRGRESISVLDLNREYLLHDRWLFLQYIRDRHLDYITEEYKLLIGDPDGSKASESRKVLFEAVGDKTPFAGMARSYFRAEGLSYSNGDIKGMPI